MNSSSAFTGPGMDAPVRKWQVWVGRIATALPILMFLFSAFMKLSGNPQVMDQFVNRFGFPANTLVPIGILELLCALIYAIPRTSVLGAVLLTGYLGGAVVTHLRIGDPAFFSPFLVGLVVWLGIYMRERRLHAILPVRKS